MMGRHPQQRRPSVMVASKGALICNEEEDEDTCVRRGGKREEDGIGRISAERYDVGRLRRRRLNRPGSCVWLCLLKKKLCLVGISVALPDCNFINRALLGFKQI
jgi:hypothetical protein